MAVSFARPIVIVANGVRVWRKDSDSAMFEPEYLNLTCPRCHDVEIYFDPEVGLYCMLCGRQFSKEEIELIVETEALRTAGYSGSSGDWQLAGERAGRRHALRTHLGHSIVHLLMTCKHRP